MNKFKFLNSKGEFISDEDGKYILDISEKQEFLPKMDEGTADTLLARADNIARSYNVAARFDMTAQGGM